MTRMTGLTLIVIGILTTGSGIWILFSNSQIIISKHTDEIIPVESIIVKSSGSVSTDENNVYKNAGLDFEKYVVMKFSKEHFAIKNWEGDKFVEGRYAETSTDPDLKLELSLKGKLHSLAVECKWRSKPNDNFIQFANDGQLQRYQEFERNNNIPTFIVLGIGGHPSAPELVYIIPVSKFSKSIQHIDNIQPYQRLRERNFFFDPNKRLLK